ncbi:MAG: hypothetical protein JW741_01175, partial [Sedimentisphaerales bacterium]|nr:hypothetical protein [Sedimentisphaerales bacterium]
RNDGTVWAWGQNWWGKLGDGTTTDRSAPVQVVDGAGGFLTGMTTIAAGGEHSLAIKNDGATWSWGANSSGELGDGTTTDRLAPVQVVDGSGGVLTGVTAVAAGRSHSLALRNDDTVWAWGYNYDGQLGDGTTNYRSAPVQVVDGAGGLLAGMTAIAAGGEHSLALRNDGTVWAWGQNWWGKLGDGTTTDRSAPVQVADGAGGLLTGMTAIAAGGEHSLALRNDGTVWAWGDHYQRRFGDGTTTDPSAPVQVVDGAGGFLTGVTAIAAGGQHSLVLRNDGTVRAWGDNYDGQLGDGTTNHHSAPVQVVDGSRGLFTGATAVAAGHGHSLALRNDETVWAWGYNYNGQLGDGTTTDRSVPVQVVDGAGGFLTGMTAVAAGSSHSLAIRNDGTVWAWGYNYNGQLGDGTTTDRSAPVQVVDGAGGFLTGVMAITAGGGHGLALKTDGTVWAWGLNWWGQLGDGTTDLTFAPVQVVDGTGGVLTGVTAIAAGGEHSLFLCGATPDGPNLPDRPVLCAAGIAGPAIIGLLVLALMRTRRPRF